MSTIILAHGLFGFGDLGSPLLPLLPSIHYFNRVAEHLLLQGHTVFEPQVDPIGSVRLRGDQLAEKIKQFLDQRGPGDRVHILAHSMGGLDARHALTNRDDIFGRVATLVTIGTPHLGSPVADALVKGTGPLFPNIPLVLKLKLEAIAGAIPELTTDFCTKFDNETGDRKTVRYIEVAGDASKGDELFLFDLAAAIGQIEGVNDGVVTRKSALREGHEHLDDWPVDHAGEIGWTKAVLNLNPLRRQQVLDEHLARYDAIVQMLR